MPFEIIRNDIVNMQVDAIVNTANPRPVIGSGTDAAIHAKAGPMLLAARKLIGVIHTGEARATLGFRLPAKYVIHTVGPVWEDGAHGEAELLRQCYENSLKLAWRHRFKTVAFPLISTGNYGFPKQLALQVAVDTIRDFLREHELHVYLVVFNKEAFELSSRHADNIRSFIDECYAREREKTEYSFAIRREYEDLPQAFEVNLRSMPVCEPEKSPEETMQPRKRPTAGVPKAFGKEPLPKAAFDPGELTQMVRAMDAGFSETLLKLIDESGKKDSEVYKKANVDRKLFSKIRNNPKYKPSKATAVAFAIALELDLEETKDLIGRAGYALSRSNPFDIIIEYFITHGHYDILEINMMLFEFDQSLLGA